MGRYMAGAEQTFIKKALSRSDARLLILDVGGGHGQHSSFVHELGHSPVLVDFDPEPIEIFLKERTDIPAIHASGLELPIRDAAFDVVLTIEVSPCTTGEGDKNVRYFADVHRILKKNGRFLFTAHNKNSYIGRLKKLSKNAPDFEDLYYLEGVAEYTKKLRETGFDVEKCWGYRWPPFTRSSNNPLIPVFAILERVLFLRRLPHVSPWLFIAARKI